MRFFCALLNKDVWRADTWVPPLRGFNCDAQSPSLFLIVLQRRVPIFVDAVVRKKWSFDLPSASALSLMGFRVFCVFRGCKQDQFNFAGVRDSTLLMHFRIFS